MRLLAISTDNQLSDKKSSVFKRHKISFEGVDVDYVLLVSGDAKTVQQDGLRVYRVGGRNKLFTLFQSKYLLWKLGRKRSYQAVVTQDVLFTGILGYIFSRWKGIPFFPQLHGDYLDHPVWLREKWMNRFLNILGKALVRRASCVRVVSERIADYVKKNFGISEERVRSIPIGTDLSVFRPNAEVARELIVLFVGRLVLEKFPLEFCKVVTPLLKSYNTLRAVIVGDGAEKQNMEQYFRMHGVEHQVQFTGRLAPEALAQWYQKSYCLVHPSLREGWGMVMIEALACGCPVVTTDTGCAGEVVRDQKNGVVTPVGDRDALRFAVEYLLQNPNVQKTFSKQGILDAQEWSFVHLKHRLRDWYISQLL